MEYQPTKSVLNLWREVPDEVSIANYRIIRVGGDYEASLPQRMAGKLEVDSIMHRATVKVKFSVWSKKLMKGKSWS